MNSVMVEMHQLNILALDASETEWTEAIFFRENIKGVQKETWHHTNGCRLWLEVERSTITHEITSVKACHPQIDSITKNKT